MRRQASEASIVVAPCGSPREEARSWLLFDCATLSSDHDFLLLRSSSPLPATPDLLAAGPFGQTDRYDGYPEATEGEGYFERPIGVYRMQYSYVGAPAREAGGADDGRQSLFYFAPHASLTSVYLPVLCSMSAAPTPLAKGTIAAIDRGAAYWAFRIVKQAARGLPWDRCLELIQQRQQHWEATSAKMIADGTASEAKCNDLARSVVEDWWKMQDELLLRFGDGWEYEWGEEDGLPHHKPLAYPRAWLEKVGFFDRP